MDNNFREWYEELLDKQTLRAIDTEAGIIKMERNISKLGHKKVWNYIEAISKFQLRILFRRWFFKAGGFIPVEE